MLAWYPVYWRVSYRGRAAADKGVNMKWDHFGMRRVFLENISSLTHWLLGEFEWNLGLVIFKLILVIDAWSIYYEIALRWTAFDLADDKSTLV